MLVHYSNYFFKKKNEFYFVLNSIPKYIGNCCRNKKKKTVMRKLGKPLVPLAVRNLWGRKDWLLKS